MYWNISSVFAHQLPHNVESLTCLTWLLSRPCDGWCPLIKLDAETCSSSICLLSSPAAALQSLYWPSGISRKKNRVSTAYWYIALLLRLVTHFYNFWNTNMFWKTGHQNVIWPITANANNQINQSGLEANLCNQCRARENMRLIPSAGNHADVVRREG